MRIQWNKKSGTLHFWRKNSWEILFFYLIYDHNQPKKGSELNKVFYINIVLQYTYTSIEIILKQLVMLDTVTTAQ